MAPSGMTTPTVPGWAILSPHTVPTVGGWLKSSFPGGYIPGGFPKKLQRLLRIRTGSYIA